MTTVEPEYDEAEREDWYSLREYEQSLCPQCGRLLTECQDPNALFNPQVHVCVATAAQMMHQRKWLNRYEKTKPDSDGWLPTDGAVVWVSKDLPPDPGFTGEATAEALREL